MSQSLREDGTQQAAFLTSSPGESDAWSGCRTTERSNTSDSHLEGGGGILSSSSKEQVRTQRNEDVDSFIT